MSKKLKGLWRKSKMYKCEECGRSVENLTMDLVITIARTQDPNITEDSYKKEVEIATGEPMKEPEGFICPNCAQIYLKNKNNTGVKLQPVEEVRKYYGYQNKD